MFINKNYCAIMLPELKCTITENNKLLRSVAQTVDFERLYESLDKFEIELNAVITKLIIDAGDVGGEVHVDEESDDSDDQDLKEQISPKKKKKN